MLFNSLQFLLFFIVITLTYFGLKWQGRWMLLLVASCYFYMVLKPEYILILFLTIVIDYIAGIWIEKTTGPARRWLLILSLISNLGILAFFKYLGFFTENVSWLFEQLHMPEVASQVFNLGNRLFIKVLHLFGESGISSFKDNKSILPVGLSFHTFQAMSYTIEVYRGNQKAERHFGIYSLYVMFYPQLVAGPIERPQNVLWQFHKTFPYDAENVKAGLMQMAFGLFKKLVIADRLALLVDYAYGSPDQRNGLTLLAATFFYTIQIYCDFSGYSDIAIGAARVMGFSLMENFRTPYIAQSVSEFWRRWHISLSTWFRDYLYIPLGGNRKGEVRQYINMMIVFLASGLWHGPNWTYVIWGGLNGFYQILAVLRDKLLARLGFSAKPARQITSPVNEQKAQSPLRVVGNVLFTFVLIMLTWVFFRARTVDDAFLILGRIATLSPFEHIDSPLNSVEMWFSMALIAFLLVKEYFYLSIPTENTTRFAVLFVLITFVTYLFGVFSSNQFIYFQF
ncbi:MBOAT family O-acyltransferase [Spirosoma utsteinense]|uniref:D-alanyl-lipoteichoic acid acyltransferase DltB (MBOAT superfamily) n=1 Tax=Spirosoma utsteinense TaxID=2585773 RepID=A0ABR6W9G5_9BACT|nr:MBOAT family O-acyltransferase [Spirosoma utsteinense]MBC3784103.1 D-alanyl-lipoteichoic acid acyltransferase DltB (MBOAT superfamily) [Spirosoma utsteinense]MBC3792808.1 D-alanyl-lipoteichoic acid acyltransferase DltB (MBOAT superfamily) [Spirosoma utsteinense]